MLDLEKYFVCKSLLVIYAYFCILGLFAHNCSTVKLKGKCTWSAWTDCTSYGDIQHRARVCGASNSEIEGRHCNISDCRESSGEESLFYLIMKITGYKNYLEGLNKIMEGGGCLNKNKSNFWYRGKEFWIYSCNVKW